MLSLKHRLKKRTDIERVFKKGKVFKSSFFILRTIKSENNFCRFAFIVPKKVSSKANVRNKIKRRIREVVKEKMEKEFSPSDNVIIALPGSEKENFPEIKNSVEKLLKEIG